MYNCNMCNPMAIISTNRFDSLELLHLTLEKPLLKQFSTFANIPPPPPKKSIYGLFNFVQCGSFVYMDCKEQDRTSVDSYNKVELLLQFTLLKLVELIIRSFWLSLCYNSVIYIMKLFEGVWCVLTCSKCHSAIESHTQHISKSLI